jgi:PAS domain S-box-containing protein
MRKPKGAPPAARGNQSASTPPSSGRGASHVRELDAQVLLHELRVHQVELEVQNEELRRARSEMELALQRYTEIFDFSPIGYATLQGDQVIADVNLAASRILGRPRSVLSGMPFERLVTRRDRPTLEALIGEARSSGKTKTGDLHLLNDQGEVFVARLSTIPLERSEPTLLIAFEDSSAAERIGH